VKGQCCKGGRPSGRLARQLPGAAASLTPGAALLLLPKCPLCVAAWLTAATGIGIPLAAAAYIRGLIVVFWIAVAALWSVRIIRLRGERTTKRAEHRGDRAPLHS